MRIGAVIGATGGIGSACARTLSSSVDRVVVCGRDQRHLNRLAVDLGPHAKAVSADLTDPVGRHAIVAALGKEGDQLAWLVLASGVPLRGRIEELDEASVIATFAVNLVGPVLLLRALADAVWAPGASVVVIGSISATRSLPHRSVYAASKAGLEHFAMALAAEWAERDIRLNIVAPGIIDTPFVGADISKLARWADDRVPAARVGRPEEVAEVVRYLVVEAPRYVIGARIVVDGGAEATA